MEAMDRNHVIEVLAREWAHLSPAADQPDAPFRFGPPLGEPDPEKREQLRLRLQLQLTNLARSLGVEEEFRLRAYVLEQEQESA